MKKIITLLAVVALTINFSFAGGGWGTSAISLTLNSDPAYNYVLNNEGWTDGSWGSNTAFNAFDFGTPSALMLNGGSGDGWTDDSPGYNETSFKIYYRVYESASAPGDWASIDLSNQAYHSTNNYIYDKSDAAIDILSLATLSGTNTYTLEVVMSKNQFYDGGNWNSMVPGGQAVGYDSSIAGYKATFIKNNTSTGAISPVDNAVKIFTHSGKIVAELSEASNVDLYAITGQLICTEKSTSQFSREVESGTYLIRINGKVQKILVP